MSIKEASKRASGESPKGKNPHPYVVPECEIRNFVESLSIRDLNKAAVRFQVVADLTSGAFEGRIDRLKRSDLRLIKQLAAAPGNENYRRIMTAIIAGVGQGPIGINAAHLTASRVVGSVFKWTREYRSALEEYRNKLRSMRLTTRGS